uniref:LAGLIDADG homing endonuclease n=1 Tax=Romanomermis culicivorax TaxID=13658 RepID=A0A915KBC9_ROMCU
MARMEKQPKTAIKVETTNQLTAIGLSLTGLPPQLQYSSSTSSNVSRSFCWTLVADVFDSHCCGNVRAWTRHGWWTTEYAVEAGGHLLEALKSHNEPGSPTKIEALCSRKNLILNNNRTFELFSIFARISIAETSYHKGLNTKNRISLTVRLKNVLMENSINSPKIMAGCRYCCSNRKNVGIDYSHAQKNAVSFLVVSLFPENPISLKAESPGVALFY